MSNKFVFKKVISSTGTQPYIYKNDKDEIYALMTNSSENSVWIDLMISYDDGETWLLDEYLPVDIYKLYDAKIVTIGENRYIFAHGPNDYGVDTIRYIKYGLFRDSEDVYAWDEEWKDFFSNYSLNARVTDIKVDWSNNYIHIVYDKARANNTYGVYYAIYELNSESVVYNQPIAQSIYDQHNAKLTQVGDTSFNICWEENNEYGKNQIRYTIFDSFEKTFSGLSTLSVKESKDKFINSYHPSIVADSLNNVHITWLTTRDNFDTSEICYLNICNGITTDTQILSEKAENNKYPFIMCDENDNLYILYNYVSQGLGDALASNNQKNMKVQYLVKKYDSNDWDVITDLINDNWNVVCGWCMDRNIYSLIMDMNDICFLRIDTAIAEVFAPVSDFKIESLTNSEVVLSWTKARNAEAIALERLNDDRYVDATLVRPLSVTDVWAHPVNLSEGIYKFRIKYITTDNVENVKYLDKIYELEGPETDIYWEPIDNIIKQTLQYTKESWSEIQPIPVSSDSIKYKFAQTITRYRLHITGGVADGYSNEVRPLTIEFGDDVKLKWHKINNINQLIVQESIDNINWYKANTKEVVDKDSDGCTIEKLNNVTYYYRLLYENKYGIIMTSNVVTITNTLKEISHTFHSVVLHWNDVAYNEGKLFQYSVDHGLSWKNILYPVNNNKMTIPNLKHNTEYQFRLGFPLRYTGNYSNVVTITTNKKPVKDLEIIETTKTIAKLKFSVDESYSDIQINISGEEEKTYLLSELTHEVNDIIDNTVKVGENITFDLEDLHKGSYYTISVTPLESNLGDISNEVYVNTDGDGIQTFSIGEINSHDIELLFDDIDRITDENVEKYLFVHYSFDNKHWEVKPITSINNYILEHLMQHTEYQIYLECLYGDNKGISETQRAITEPENFEALYGQRIPGERTFCKTEDAFYVLDKGILYRVNDDEQDIVKDYGLQANHVYGSIDKDNNDNLHIVMSYGKNIYYATDIDGFDIEDLHLIEKDDLTNEIMFPDVKVCYDNSIIITYEKNYGYYSDVMYVKYKDGEKNSGPTTLLHDNKINSCPRNALKNSHNNNKGANGFFVACIDNENSLKIINYVVNNDKESEEYKSETFSYNSFLLEDNLVGYYNDIKINCDNLDAVHLTYSSYNANSRSMTYAALDEDKLSQFVFNRCEYLHVVPASSFVAIVEKDFELYTSKFSFLNATFTDPMKIEEQISEQNNNVTTINDETNIYVLSFDDGKILIHTLSIADIEENNNYINNNWIANEFSIEDGDCTIQVWTDGKTNEYPLMYVKINNLVSDITPRDNDGNKTCEEITITSLENTNDLYVYKLEYNDTSILIDANIRLMYDWNKNEIINKK